MIPERSLDEIPSGLLDRCAARVRSSLGRLVLLSIAGPGGCLLIGIGAAAVFESSTPLISCWVLGLLIFSWSVALATFGFLYGPENGCLSPRQIRDLPRFLQPAFWIGRYVGPVALLLSVTLPILLLLDFFLST